jgi:hypothetical protein
MIYLTAIGLTPGGSNTAHIYIQTYEGARFWYSKMLIFFLVENTQNGVKFGKQN